MSQQEVKPVSFYILDKQYQAACPDDEKDALLASAHFLDMKMREIRDSGKVVGVERIAVMAALNIAHELLQNQKNGQVSDEASSTIRHLQDRIDTVLASLDKPAA
ncbi:MAG: cell division protein ZapA [Gammaproteobacteria bacterium]|nr:cell division protein ZapA [Gammaproteobacteria bacterium]